MTAFALPLPPWIYLEEESEGDDYDWDEDEPEPEDSAEVDAASPPPAGGQPPRQPRRSRVSAEILRSLMEERKAIIDSSLKTRHKVKLLETNRRAMTIARGGRVLATENVVYALIGMSMAVLVLLACLTAFSTLPKEVTLTFAGTVVGGLIATVAQKIGRL